MRHPTEQRGYILIETVVAAVVLGVTMVLTVSLLGWTASQRLASERRGWASQEASNIMERLCAAPFTSLSQDFAAQRATLSPGATAVLPGARVEVRVADDPSTRMKRIDVQVVWTASSGLPDRPAKLTAWVADKGATP